MKKQFLVFLFVSLVCFGQEKNYNYIIEGSIFKISYNEQYEQPNWIEYRVINIKNLSLKGLNQTKIKKGTRFSRSCPKNKCIIYSRY